MKPESILAWEMNYQTLPEKYGAPLRLRIENQVGYKMVKWISKIEFLETAEFLGKGSGGKNEDGISHNDGAPAHFTVPVCFSTSLLF